MADRIKNYQQEADQITTLKAIRTDFGVTPSSYTPDATVVTKDRVVTFAQAEEELVVLSDIEKGVKQQVAEVDIAQKDIANIKALLQGHLYDYQTDSTSAYTKSVPSGAMPYAGIKKVGGKTIVMNQFIKNDASSEQVGLTQYTNNGDGSWSVVRTGGTTVNDKRPSTSPYDTFPTIMGHKYLFTGIIGGSESTYLIRCIFGTNFSVYEPVIYTETVSKDDSYIVMRTKSECDTTLRPQVIDLTLMFGAGNEPSTVEEFEAMFPASYYSYSAPTLLSAGVTDVVSKGANLIPTYTTSGSENGLTWTVSEDGSITINGTATDGTPIFAPISSWQWDGRTPCWLSGCPNGGSTNSYFLDIYGEDEWGDYQISEGDTGNGVILQPRSNSENISNIPLRFRIVIISGTQCNNLTFKPILNYGASAATYAPYIGTISTYSIPASIQALDGYGWSAGSVYNYIDYERKVFVKRVGKVVLDGTQTLTLTNWLPTANGVGWIYAYNITNNKIVGNWDKSNIVSTSLLAIEYGNIFHNQLIGMATYMNNTSGICIYQTNTSLTDATAINAYLSANPITVYYELATPQETDISEYLTDDNLINVESGGTLTFPNQNGTDYQIPVPSEETYMIDLQEAINNG